jgi:hypothetical protein
MAAVFAGGREGTAMTRTQYHNKDWKHKIQSAILQSLHVEEQSINNEKERPWKEDAMI